MPNLTQANGPSQTLWWNKPIVYWQANQVVITFHSPLSRSEGDKRVIESLKLDDLEQFLAAHGFQLASFTNTDVPQPEGPSREAESHTNDLNSPVGKYLFPDASGWGTLAICCFNSTNPTLAPTSSRYGQGKQGPTTTDSTRALVTLLNQNLETLKQHGNIPIVAAMPNWMGGVNGGISVNCPACPPIPVTGNETSYSNWHFTLPQLSSTLQDGTGDGVSVFVLDTIPSAEHIRKAAELAGGNNLLLQDIVAAMDSAPPSIVVDHQHLPTQLGADIEAGKDLDGTLMGFKMADHGLYVAGIIHDLAPRAKIECVRILNDSGVGDVATLCAALMSIQERMELGGLEQVVVNLSLEISPSDTSLPGIWFSDGGACCFQAQDLSQVIGQLGLLRLGLHQVIQSLTSQGAVIIASSGNESNTHNHPPQRFGPRYPGAFPEVICVGAVDKNWQATSYSDYPALAPQHNGIATYGGAIPAPLPPGQPGEPPGAKTWAKVDDAVVGVYSSPRYPLLLATDRPPEEYDTPTSSHGWAYWSGTSFASPIISALAARVHEARRTGYLPTSLSVEDMITTAPGQQLLTGNGLALPNTSGFGLSVGTLYAKQAGS